MICIHEGTVSFGSRVGCAIARQVAPLSLLSASVALTPAPCVSSTATRPGLSGAKATSQVFVPGAAGSMACAQWAPESWVYQTLSGPATGPPQAMMVAGSLGATA